MKDFLYYVYYMAVVHWESLYAYQAEVRYFILTALLLIILSIGFVAVLYSRRWYLLSREKKWSALKFRFQFFIYDALVERSKQEVLSSTDLIVNKFKQHELKSGTEKQLMIDLMIELKKSFSGNSKKQFQHLYICLGLHHISIAKLTSSNKLEKIKGIRELSEMEYHCEALEHAFKNWQSCPDTLLADEVKLAAIRSGSIHMLYFLYYQKEPLSQWLCLQLQYHLEALPHEKLPRLIYWLNVQETSSIVFVLRMIALFKQVAAEHVIPLLNHPVDEVCMEAINTLEVLEARQYVDVLFNLLEVEQEDVKIQAIQAIGKLGNSFHANLLKSLLRQQAEQVTFAVKAAIELIDFKDSSNKSTHYSITH